MSSSERAASAGVFAAAVTVAMVCDALDTVGHRAQALDPALQPLARPARLVGRARTVNLVETEGLADADDPYRDMISFIDGLSKGDVVVIAAHTSSRSGCWGELFTAAATARGANGVVCDGYVRDTAKVVRMSLPVFACGRRPYDYRARLRALDFDEPVVCGGVRIAAGDLLLGDDDGVVCVPGSVERAVVEVANDRAAAEPKVLAELAAGALLRDVWERHRLL